MRTRETELGLGSIRIKDIKLNPKSRDDIPALMLGLQAIHGSEETRERLFALLEDQVAPTVRSDTGRPGMTYWQILVLGVLQVGLDCDWDRLQTIANEMKTVRQMLGLDPILDDDVQFERQTVIDNVSLLTPAILRDVNELVVATGHEVVRKKPGAPLHGRVDSFVVETDVRHPTDVSLLWDAVRTALKATERLARCHGLTGWRQHRHWQLKLQRLFRSVRRQRGWTKKASVRPYVRLCTELLTRMQASRDALPVGADTAVLDERLAQAAILLDQVRRRLLDDETIPAAEKLYSVFEPHTRWIAKGKAKAPVELGVPATILADEHGFVLGAQLQWEGGDVAAAVPLVEACQATYPTLEACSFDRGFHSPANRLQLDARLTLNALPKKGYRNVADQARENDPAFRAMRQWHAGVESAIHHLECHGLGRVRTHGREGFERTVMLAMVAANLHRLGLHLRARHTSRRRPPTRELPLAA